MGADPLLEAVARMSETIPEPRPTGEQTKQDAVKVENSEETPKGDTETDEPKYTVKLNGEEIEVPLSELKLGYMRERDYRHKTAKVSEKSKELETKLSSLDEKIQDAEALIELDLNYLESDDGKELRQEDPDQYLKKVEALKAKSEKLRKHKEERAKRESEKRAEKLKSESQKLQEKISDWLDEDIKTRESNEIVKYLMDQGYSQEEIANIDDHRVFVTARDAVKLHKIMSQDLSEKEVKKPPKSVKPGSSEKKEVRSEKDKLRDKLKKSHDMNDAARLLKEVYFKNNT